MWFGGAPAAPAETPLPQEDLVVGVALTATPVVAVVVADIPVAEVKVTQNRVAAVAEVIVSRV
jgi:hypothetical protein